MSETIIINRQNILEIIHGFLPGNTHLEGKDLQISNELKNSPSNTREKSTSPACRPG